MDLHVIVQGIGVGVRHECDRRALFERRGDQSAQPKG